MKHLHLRLLSLLLCACLLAVLPACGAPTPDNADTDGESGEGDDSTVNTPQYEELRLMSFNIRTQTPSDLNERNWNNRKQHVIAYLLASNADVICLQEVKVRQFEHIRVGILNTYAGVHFSASPAEENGEGLAIFFKRTLQLAESSRYWLSETPEYQSLGWGAENLRIAATALFRTESGTYFNIINTHLDHRYAAARENGMALILERMPKDRPTFICGDFNETSSGEGYKQIAAVMQDTQVVAPVTDSGSTFHSWGAYADDTSNNHFIDFWFASNDATVLEFDILKDTVSEGVYYSDHFAITTRVKVQIPEKKK